MKHYYILLALAICSLLTVDAQTLDDAKKLFLDGKYKEAFPVFVEEYKKDSANVSLNQWMGVCLYETDGDLLLAEKHLQVSDTKNIRDAALYLGKIYTTWWEVEKAEAYFDKYEEALNSTRGKTRAQREADKALLPQVEELKDALIEIKRTLASTEDIQIIDSLVIEKEDFLSAYKLSKSGGSLEYFDELFQGIGSTVYTPERGLETYFAEQTNTDSTEVWELYRMDYLLDGFKNKRLVSADRFGLKGNLNCPFVMQDGVTIYFAAEDEENMGGYDIFVSRLNASSNAYLRPERLNPPFNSVGNDYMMVLDEVKGVGWFATDRATDSAHVCIYTFIPNQKVKNIDSDDFGYLASRARIDSIKATWAEDVDYSPILLKAREEIQIEDNKKGDFEFVIDDDRTYYTLSDFRSPTARNYYAQALEMEKELNEALDALDSYRDSWMSANAEQRKSLASFILNLEKKQADLVNSLEQQKIRARNVEITEKY